MIVSIDNFIQELRNEKHIENTINPYADNSSSCEYARHNLKIYLNNIYKNNTKILFIGESPGYKGCRLTGVPFTSEKILISDLTNKVVGKNFDYKVRNIDKPQSENSATIVWNGLKQYDIYPLMWNAFPFHPYKAGNTESNRKPTGGEQELGNKYINLLLEIFEIKKIYAVGNTAYSTLNNMGYKVEKIRHPSNVGKSQFLEGLEKVKLTSSK